MSRSGYGDDDTEECPVWFWAQAVKRAIHGKRGQSFLREMIEALDAMPKKRLIKDEIEEDGNVCALGAVARKRALDLMKLNELGNRDVAHEFGISFALTCEITYLNDEEFWRATPEQRWQKMREWAIKNLDQHESKGGNDGR